MDVANSIIDEIQNNYVSTAIIVLPPYNENMTLEEKFSITYRELQRKTRNKNRILSLVNAFYLGKLLDETPDRLTLSRYQNKMTSHFFRISRNTFKIFKDFPKQIGETTSITVQIIQRLKEMRLIEL